MTDIWLDYSGLRPDPRHLKRLGVKGVLRYLSADQPATEWKRITHGEKDAILDAGLDLILNWEWYEGRMLEGYYAGYQDGQEALAQAKSLGYPKGASIYFSHDTSARSDNAVAGYLQGAQHAFGDYYNADIYSGIDVVEMAIRRGRARYGWQTIAWSYGRVGRAHIYQNGNWWFGRSADEDRIRHTPLGSWHDHATEAHPPKPAPSAPNPIPQRTPEHLYRVQKGETMARIAIAHHTTVKEILRLNPQLVKAHKKGQGFVHEGWLIFLPGKASPVHHPVPPKVRKYRIVSGDTLSAIAHHFHTTVPQLMKWNKGLIKNPNRINVGWIIRVG